MPDPAQAPQGSAAQPSHVTPPPFRVAVIDQSTLLTVIELSYFEGCRVTPLSDEAVVVKYEPARTYLTMTPQQLEALKLFGPGRSASQVVFQLIVEHQSLPLREFYELVVKAYERGILQTKGHTAPPAVVAWPWRWQVDARWMRGVAAATMIAALVTMIVRPMEMPEHWWQLVIGWALSCAAVSGGYFLAACAVRRAGAEVYRPKFQWKSPWPHFHVDLDDAVMGGRQAVVDAGLMRLMPVFFLLTAAAFWQSGVVLPLFFTVMILLSPLWWSPGLSTIHALYGTPRGDATQKFRFEPNRAHWYALKTRLKLTNLRFFGIHAVYTPVWLGIVGLAATLLLDANAVELWQRYRASGGLHFTMIAVLVALGLAVLGVAGVFGWIGWSVVRDWWRERQRLQIKPRPATVTPEAVGDLLRQALLFNGLTETERAAIAAAVQVEEFPAGAVVVREGTAGDKLYLVYSGRVEVVRETKAGRPDPVAMLQSGDLFGEVAMLQTGLRTRSVRAVEKCVLLGLSREVFQNVVLSKLSRDSVEETIQKIGFLHRSPLARNWPPHAMTAFSRRASFRDFQEGEIIIREGEDNLFFYMLYEGQVEVRVAGRDIAQLNIGDFFGEISLLQNSVARATIKALTSGRCLQMAKRDFLNFLATDFVIGLQFESMGSKRLGQAIFPAKGVSIDVTQG